MTIMNKRYPVRIMSHKPNAGNATTNQKIKYDTRA